MATQNLLQRLDVAADTTGSSVDASNRRIEETFIAAEAVSAGDFLCLDLSQSDDSDKALKVKKATDVATAVNTGLCVGVCIADADADAAVRVLLRGIIDDANVATGAAAGSSLIPSSTAGRCDAATATDTAKIVAYSLEAATSNTAKVYVFPQF